MRTVVAYIMRRYGWVTCDSERGPTLSCWWGLSGTQFSPHHLAKSYLAGTQF